MLEKTNENIEFERILSDADRMGLVGVHTYLEFPEAVWLWNMAKIKGIYVSILVSEIISDAAFGPRP